MLRSTTKYLIPALIRPTIHRNQAILPLASLDILQFRKTSPSNHFQLFSRWNHTEMDEKPKDPSQNPNDSKETEGIDQAENNQGKKDGQSGESGQNGQDEKAQDERDTELALFREQLEITEGKVAEMQDKLLRALAEVENVRRRSALDIENAKKFANQKFAQSLLSVADNLFRALDSVPKDQLSEENGNEQLRLLYEGVDMTRSELIKTFRDHQIEEYNPMGQKMDPNTMEAMFELEDPSKDPGTVGFIMQTGYKMHERVIRPAKVGVVKKST